MSGTGSEVNRRQFFARSAMAAGAIGGGLFDGLAARSAFAQGGDRARNAAVGYGDLVPAGQDLALPPGFQYRLISVEGQRMSDGYPVPKAMDGMGALPLPNGNILLIRNHEDSQLGHQFAPRPPGSTSTSAGMLADRLHTHYGPRAFAYDAHSGGGTTSLEVEPYGRRRVVREHWSLVGTQRNCAGGVTPWGSWLTCEETLDGPGPFLFQQLHGFVFEVPVNTAPNAPVTPQPLTQLGRFSHEAVAVDPVSGIVYETEDQTDGSGFYRFVPNSKPTAPGQLAGMGGVLQMLAISGQPQYVTAINQTVGVPLPVAWVTIGNPNPTPATGTESGSTRSQVFLQGFAAGGARFRRLEGCWQSGSRTYFASTNGGDLGLGQIWVYDSSNETLTLIAESAGTHQFDGPDNVCVTPRGGLIICEDGSGVQLLRGVTPSGDIFDFARNLRNTIEFAGTCFSPDGQTLFVNFFGRLTTRTTTRYGDPMQIVIEPDEYELAATAAIWGPWGSGPL